MIKRQIKKLRLDHNFSRKQLSEKMGCSMSHVINLENGNARLSDDHKEILENIFNLNEGFFGPADQEAPVLTSEYDRIIGKNIKFHRKKLGMTQAILAEESGFSQASSISAIERGQKPIGKKKLIKLAEIFNLHVSELYSTQEAAEANDSQALISDFIFLAKSDKKPSVWNAIKELIASGCREIKQMKPEL